MIAQDSGSTRDSLWGLGTSEGAAILVRHAGYACGRVTDDNANGSPAWASLMLAPRRRERLLRNTMSFANKASVSHF